MLGILVGFKVYLRHGFKIMVIAELETLLTVDYKTLVNLSIQQQSLFLVVL